MSTKKKKRLRLKIGDVIEARILGGKISGDIWRMDRVFVSFGCSWRCRREDVLRVIPSKAKK